MSSMPLPALHLQAPAPQPSPLQMYGEMLGIQNAQQEQQIRQQQQQAGAIQLQQEQQAQKDQMAFRTATQDPSNQGKTIGDIADTLAHSGNISQTAWVQAKKADIEQKQALAQYDDTTLKNAAAAHAQTQQLYNNAMNMPDDQLAQNWASIAQQYDQIPGNSKVPLDPNKPLTKDQLKQFGPMISMQEAYLQDEQKKRQTQGEIEKTTALTQEAQANTQEKQAELQMGGTQGMADARYRNLQTALRTGQPVSALDKAWMASYEKQKTLIPTASFNLQNSGLGGGNGQPSALAQSVASGQMKWGDVISPRTPMSVKQQFAAEVKAINPNFNSGDFTVEQKQREAFTSGAYSQQLNAINTAREHMKTFGSLADALNNNDVQALNKIGNEFGVQFGSDKTTNFKIAAQAFGGEVGKAFDGAGVTAGERGEAMKGFSPNMSPEQLKGAITTVDRLLQGKQNALKQTYQQGQSGKPNFGEQNGAASGLSVTAPNGKVYTFKDQASADAFKQKAGIR